MPQAFRYEARWCAGAMLQPQTRSGTAAAVSKQTLEMPQAFRYPLRSARSQNRKAK